MYSRGGGKPPDRGRGRGTGNILIQRGKKTLISKKISQEINPVTFKEYLEFKNNKEKNAGSSYANVLREHSDESPHSGYIQNEKGRIILILEDEDKRWQDQPELLMERYSLVSCAYPAGSYKSPSYWDNLLINSGSCEITHFTGQNQENYNFSKIIIKKVISPDEWGLSPFKEKAFLGLDNKTPIKYNYWDYMDAFDKVLLYENDKLKHTWMIKVCSKVYNYKIPNWFIHWWSFGGSKEEILPEQLKALYEKWKNLSPVNIKMNDHEKKIKSFMYFMIEFSIPYIWKWTTEVQSFGNDSFLMRRSQTKFWDKMLRKDPNTGIIPGDDHIKDMEEKLKSFERIQANERAQIKGKSIESKQDMIQNHIEELLTLLEEGCDADDLSDSSMATSTKELAGNTFQTLELMEDSQDPYEEQEQNLTFREILENLKSNIRKKCNKQRGESSLPSQQELEKVMIGEEQNKKVGSPTK